MLEQTTALGETSVWTPYPIAPQIVNHQSIIQLEAATDVQFFRWHEVSFTQIATTSPRNHETEVSVLRETIVHFTAPLSMKSDLTTTNFYAGYGGQRLLTRVELSPDRTTATLFYLEPLPGSSRIFVVLEGAGLTDFMDRPVDVDGDGQPGGSALSTFDTLSLTPLTGTAVIGRVFASELVAGTDTGSNAVNQPLPGVTITVDGMEESLPAVTDGQGNFTLSPVPAGRFFVHIDGRTAVNVAAGVRNPDLAYFPYVGKAWDAVPGRTNNLAGGTGTIFLPRITAGTLESVSLTTDTTISLPPTVLAQNPALNGVTVSIPANSLYSDNGTRGGKVGIAPVPPDRLPGLLPVGLEFPLVITIQTDGARNFDRPVPVRFPNLPNPKTGLRLPPSAKSASWSFNHNTGRWQIQGPMTVSADGRYVEMDPGVGVSQPGWHGFNPGCAAGGGNLNTPPCALGKFPKGADKTDCKILSIEPAGRANYCELYRADCQLGCASCLDSDDLAGYNSCIQN